MRYSIGANLADFGFGFLEKIHEPIFLVNRLGEITKINEAGRKLLYVMRVTIIDAQRFIKHTPKFLNTSTNNYKRMKIANSNLRLIIRNLIDSDYVLVEVKR